MWEVPLRGKRVLMITPDVMIDRRILIEAETLVDEGYEVYLLAGWDASQADLFEAHGKVRIERIKYEGVDHRLYAIYKIQRQGIECLNKVSAGINRLGGAVARTGIALLNRVSGASSRIGGTHTRPAKLIGTAITESPKNHTREPLREYAEVPSGLNLEPPTWLSAEMSNRVNSFAARLFRKIVSLLLQMSNLAFSVAARVFSKIIGLLLQMSNLVFSLAARLFSKIIGIFLKISNRGIYLIARFLNLCVEWVPSKLSLVSGLSGYEYAFFRRALFYRPDIIHVHDLPMLRIGVELKRRLSIPLLYDMHEYYPEQPRLTRKQRRDLRLLEKKYIHRADVAITVNFMLGDIIKKDYRLSAIQIIQNAVSSRPNYERDRKYDRFREDYPNLKERLLLLYQGYVAEERNLETAIRAMCAAREHRWVLLIMGYGDYALTLKRLAHDLKAHDRVLFVPPKTQDILLEYTASADLGLIPYPTNADINTRYVSPNKLYEFIAAGIPILSNKLPYVRHVIEENGYGLVAELNTCEGFGAAIAAIRTNQLQTYRDNIRHTGSKYSWNEEKRNLLNMYRELVQ